MTIGDQPRPVSTTHSPTTHRDPFWRRPGTTARRPAGRHCGGVPLDIWREAGGEKLSGGSLRQLFDWDDVVTWHAYTHSESK